MKQAEALQILKTGANVFLTGEPGAGKTHTINAYVAWLRERGIDPSITASTGIAATHVNGMTIHSWSGIGIKDEMSDWDIDALMSRERLVKRILEAKVLIIDEISMLDARILDSVDRVLRALRKSSLRADRPFGGLQVIFVGDFFQLPPISRGAAAAFAFESDAWREANLIVCYLEEQHRQSDAEFLEVLTMLRAGEYEEKHHEILQSRMNVAHSAKAPMRLYTHNVDVDRMNTEALGGIDSKSHEYDMQSSGSRTLVESLKKSCLSPEKLSLKKGAAVMFTRNNFEAGYANGTLGVVDSFSPEGTPVVRTFSGRYIAAEPAEWSVQDGGKILAKLTQVPLRLAWAITVHKSQGMSLESAIMDLSRAFEYGQGYVAISRVRSLSGLFLEGLNQRALALHPRVVEVDREFRQSSRKARELFGRMPASELADLQGNFLRSQGGKEPKPGVVRPVAVSGGEKLAKLREKFPNAGRGWNAEDDELLKKMFAEQKSTKAMAEQFGRKPSAITARLGHLGLIEDFWAGKRRERTKTV